jgi:hypothetical protein
MWNPGTIRANVEILDRAMAHGVVPEPTIRRWQADRCHQFMLAGAYPRLRRGRRAETRKVLGLFDLHEVRRLGLSPRWLPMRAAGAHGRDGGGAAAGRLSGSGGDPAGGSTDSNMRRS